MICPRCKIDKDVEEFPLNKKKFNKTTKTFPRQSLCRKCKDKEYASKSRANQMDQYRDKFKCNEAKKRRKYTMERFDNESSKIVGWNNDSEIYC